MTSKLLIPYNKHFTLGDVQNKVIALGYMSIMVSFFDYLDKAYAATVHSIVAYNDLAYFGGIELHFVGTIPHVQVLPGSTWESHL